MKSSPNPFLSTYTQQTCSIFSKLDKKSHLKYAKHRNH